MPQTVFGESLEMQKSKLRERREHFMKTSPHKTLYYFLQL